MDTPPRSLFLSSTLAIAALALVLSAIGCGVPEGDPVATVSVQPSRSTVPLGGPLELSIRFEASDVLEPIDHDYRVLVHFLDTDGEMMWAADHDPVTPTTEWQPSQTIEYTHRIYIPMYPYVGDAVVAVGLYSTTTGTRLTLSAEDLGQRAYRTAVVAIQPQAESSWLMYEDGWHDDEGDQGMNQHWRWTADRASLAFRNPQSDAVLFLELDGRPDLFETPQRAAIRLGDVTVRELLIDSMVPQFYEVPLVAEQFGDADTASLEIAVDQTFVPAEVLEGSAEDQRSLGVRVYYAFLEPR